MEGPISNDAIPIGTVLNFGGDWGLTDASGGFSPDATYVLKTSDNATIFITGQGHVPYENIAFQTGNNSYSWLNNIVAFGSAAPTASGIALDVWQVRVITASRYYVREYQNSLTGDKVGPAS